jgi:hypothetical protein
VSTAVGTTTCAVVDTQRFPEVAANRHQLTTLSDREVYPAAMDMLLDAVEAAAARSTKS